jgi:hypothetical protein
MKISPRHVDFVLTSQSSFRPFKYFPIKSVSIRKKAPRQADMSQADYTTASGKRRRTVLENKTEDREESAAGDDGLAKSPALGLMPLVAEYINDFINPQGHTVYIVESGVVLPPIHEMGSPGGWQEDIPTKFQSTVLDVFSTEAAARSCMRKEMEEKFLADAWIFDGSHDVDDCEDDATFGDFYCGGGTNEEEESAIQSLLDGQQGAEEKFYFPWLEGSDSTRLFYACCGRLSFMSVPRSDDDDEDDEVSYDWTCNEDFGQMLAIRALNVENIDRANQTRGLITSQNAAVKESGVDGLARDRPNVNSSSSDSDLGLVPMVAQQIKSFIGPQGRIVFIVETMFIPDPRNQIEPWADRPTKFESTLVGVFSISAAARACIRSKMEEKMLLHSRDIDRQNVAAACPWAKFYCDGGASEQTESAVKLLRDGHEGAEGKFHFPWSESSDSERLFFASCGYLNTKTATKKTQACRWGYTFVIRALLVK